MKCSANENGDELQDSRGNAIFGKLVNNETKTLWRHHSLQCSIWKGLHALREERTAAVDTGCQNANIGKESAEFQSAAIVPVNAVAAAGDRLPRQAEEGYADAVHMVIRLPVFYPYRSLAAVNG